MKKGITVYMQHFGLDEGQLSLIRDAHKIMNEAGEIEKLAQALEEWVDKTEVFDYTSYKDTLTEEGHYLWGDVVSDPLNPEFISRQHYLAQVFSSASMPYSAFCLWLTAYYRLLRKAYQRQQLLSDKFLISHQRLEQVHHLITAQAYIQNEERSDMVDSHAYDEMSTPTAQLWDAILLLPLAGVFDNKRAHDMFLRVLNKVGEVEAKVLILDIRGVPFIDSEVANNLMKISKAIRLMGCQCIISGISPAVAETIVNLGIHLDQIFTTGALSDALEYALRIVNIKMVAIEEKTASNWQAISKSS